MKATIRRFSKCCDDNVVRFDVTKARADGPIADGHGDAQT